MHPINFNLVRVHHSPIFCFTRQAVIWLFFCLSCVSARAQDTLADHILRNISAVSDTVDKEYWTDSLLTHYWSLGDSNSLNSEAEYALSAISLLHAVTNDTIACRTYLLTGMLYRFTDDFQPALTMLYQGLHIAKKLKDFEYQAEFYDNLSVVYGGLKNYDASIEQARNGIALLGKFSFFRDYDADDLYLNAADAFSKLGQPDSTRKYIRLMENVDRHLGEYMNAGWISYLKAGLSEAQNNPALTDSLFRGCVSLTSKNSDNATLVYAAQEYCRFLMTRGDWSAAKYYAEMCIRAGASINAKIPVIEAQGYLSSIWHREGQIDSAYYYLKLQNEMQNRTFDPQKSNAIEQIDQKEKLTDIEEQRQDAQKAEIRRHNIEYTLIIFALICLALICILLYRTHEVSNQVVEGISIFGLLVFFELLNLLIHPLLENHTGGSPLLMLPILLIVSQLVLKAHHFTEKWIKQRLETNNQKIRLRKADKDVAETNHDS